MDEAWYQRVLSACALLPDLKVLPATLTLTLTLTLFYP